jgi:hypothetical protein
MKPLPNANSARLFLVVLALAAAPLWHPAVAQSAKLHCRSLSFFGEAGDCQNPDHVLFQMVDVKGNVIHRSCEVFVHGGETALGFGSRLTRDLGATDNCSVDVNPPPVKKCWNGVGGSCKYKWKAKKQLLEACCWQTPDCTGTKVGNYCHGTTTKCATDADCVGNGGTCDLGTGTKGISAQKKIIGHDDDFNPTAPVGYVTTLVQLDPIGMTQLPFPALGSCRTGIAGSMLKLALTTAHQLVECHHRQMLGEPLDCDSVNPDSDPADAIATAEAAVAQATSACAPGGSPRDLGYGTCPAPCAISINTCAAPTARVGASCNTDADCDSAPSAGDGKCGRPQDWAAAASCMACQAEEAIVAAMEDKYGTAGSGMPPEDVKCQDTIGREFADLMRVHLAITTKCQKLLDGGKAVLAFCQNGQCVAPASRVGATCMTNDDCTPSDTQLCKYADQSKGRILAEMKGRFTLEKACGQTDISTLDTCGIDLPGLEDCVVDNGRTVGTTIADAIFPEGVGHDVP